MIKSRSFIQGLVTSFIICTMLAITAAPAFAGNSANTVDNGEPELMSAFVVGEDVSELVTCEDTSAITTISLDSNTNSSPEAATDSRIYTLPNKKTTDNVFSFHILGGGASRNAVCASMGCYPFPHGASWLRRWACMLRGCY